MGQHHSRERDSSYTGDLEDQSCRRGLFPCWDSSRRQLPPARTSMTNARLGMNSQASLRTDNFQSCDELPQASQVHLLQMRASISAMNEINLPPGGDEVTKRLAKDLQHLEAIIEGKDTSTYTKEVTSTPKTKQTLKNVVHQIQAQAKDSMKEGAMAPALNSLIKILWPRIGSYVKDLIATSIEPSINESLPGVMKGAVKFTKVTLGDSSPMLGPLWVEHNDNGAIEFHMGMNIATDMDVELHAMGITVGVSKFSLKGKMVILMDPPMDKPPFFGGLQVYFPNPPEINLNFVGAARVVDMPMLRSAVRGAIDGAVAGACVLPRRIAVDMDDGDDVDITDLTYPEPIGIVRLTLWSGEKLIAADRSLWGGPGTSDPYVVASLGVSKWKSPTIKKTLEPVWGGAEGLTFDLPVHDDCQELSLKVYDEDFGSADDLIGSAKKEVARLITVKGKQAVALLKENGEEGGGNLTISASFLKLVAEKPSKPLSNPSQAHLSIKVLTIRGLQKLQCGSEHPFKVRIQAITPDEGSNAISMPSNSSVKSTSSSLKTLKSSKSMVPAGVQGKVLVEETTNASHPKEQKELAEALRGVAVNLHERKTNTKEIAEILKVSEPQVQRFLEKHDQTDKKVLKAHEEAMLEERSVHHPRFDEVIQMLLPAEACDELSVVEFAVINKRQKVIATAMIPMSQLLAANDLMCEGPFRCEDNDDVEVVAKAHLRWLA